MDNKIQNIVLKSVSALIIFLGVFFTLKVMGDDNPNEMSYEQQEQWAIKEAIDQELNKTKTEAELNAFKAQRTTEIAAEKEETLSRDVSRVIDFSIYMLYLAALLIVAAFVYLAVIDTKKALKILTGVALFILVMVVVYYASSNSIPEGASAEKASSITDMNLASTAINATGLLIGIALLGWLGGAFVKAFR